MACGETKGIQRGDSRGYGFETSSPCAVRLRSVAWMVEYSVLVCNSLGVLKAGRVTSVRWRKIRRARSRRRKAGGGRHSTCAVDRLAPLRRSPAMTVQEHINNRPNPLRDSDEPSPVENVREKYGCTDELIRDRESNP